ITRGAREAADGDLGGASGGVSTRSGALSAAGGGAAARFDPPVEQLRSAVARHERVVQPAELNARSGSKAASGVYGGVQQLLDRMLDMKVFRLRRGQRWRLWRRALAAVPA
ncbi:MAG: hypothetical protein ACK4MU_05335, partial [Thermomonas sp.]